MSQRLTWLPLAAALYVIALAPWAPIEYVADSMIYADQAADIRALDVPSGRYPPGLATALAAGDLVGLEMWQVIKLIALALVALVVIAARRLAGSEAGAVAGLLCCGSPWLIASSQYVMSDSLGAAIAMAGLIAVLARRPALAAVSAVIGVLVRLMSGVGIVALMSVGRRWAVTSAVGAAVLFGAFQWAASGSPFTTGYEDGHASWAPSYITDDGRLGDNDWFVDGNAAKASVEDTPERDWPNLVAYPLMVLGVTYAFMPPFVAVIGLWALWSRRRTAAAQFAGGWLGGSIVLVLPYYWQTPRFLAPAMMLLLVYTAAGIVDVFDLARQSRRRSQGWDGSDRTSEEVETARLLALRDRSAGGQIGSRVDP